MHIINLIFLTGKVPLPFKISTVTPIYKKGCKTDITNYRPISVITTFAKIFEKCLKNRLYDYLTSNNILNGNQYGFIKGTSTNKAMYKLTDDIKRVVSTKMKRILQFFRPRQGFRHNTPQTTHRYS